MVTMRLWLGRLAAGFALTAGGFTTYMFSQTPDGRQAVAELRAAHPKVAKAVDSAVVAGQETLDHMIQTAMMAPEEVGATSSGDEPVKDEGANAPSAELNFRVVSSSPSPALPALGAGSAKGPTAISEAAVAEPTRSASEQVAKIEAPLSPVATAAAALPEEAAAIAKPVIAAAPASAATAAAAAAPASQKFADGFRSETKPHAVEERIKARVSDEMRQFFDLYLYVSKAEKGSWAQRMYVMAKQPDDTYALVDSWMVSTGKEEMMRNPHGVVMNTDTPEGFFRLDRGRFFADYTSYQWKAPMPHAMFFDWQIEGRRSGLAIHGTGPDEDEMLGQRASKGCIRLSPAHAEKLYKLITENYAGKVPQLKIDPETGTQSTNGLMRRDSKGRILMKHGYRVLVVIENYGGPSTDTIATIM
jgi:lipoprotein-anchoring transpeptidase ErfK/SrfK